MDMRGAHEDVVEMVVGLPRQLDAGLVITWALGFACPLGRRWWRRRCAIGRAHGRAVPSRDPANDSEGTPQSVRARQFAQAGGAPGRGAGQALRPPTQKDSI